LEALFGKIPHFRLCYIKFDLVSIQQLSNMNFYLLLAVLISLISASPTYIKEFNRQSQPTNLAVPFTLSAHFPGNVIDGLQFQANSYHFYLGLNRSSAYCPAVVGKACPNSTATVVINGAMVCLSTCKNRYMIRLTG